MPAFDIVSEVDMQEVDNAVNQASKEISNRFDFKGSKSTLEFDKEKKEIKILADDDMKLRSIHQVLGQKLIKRSVDLSCLEYGNEDEVSGGMIRQVAKLKQGLEKPDAKKIVKLIKDSKLKVQAQIQDEQVRVTGKKIDDLQSVIATLKSSDLKLPLQFVNMRS